MLLILHPDGRVMPLDVVTDMSVSETAVAAEHPIEEGAPVVDHVEKKNVVWTFGCKITETPTETVRDLDFSGSGNVANSAASGQDVLTGIAGTLRPLFAVEFLRDCVGVRLDIVSTEGRLSEVDLLLTQWPQQVGLLRNRSFTLTFVQPRFVTTENVPVPPRKTVPASVTSDPKEVNKSPDEVEEPQAQSVFHAMVGSVVSFFTGGE